MAFKIRPMWTLGTPGLGALAGIGQPGLDGFRKLCLTGFGYAPDGSLAPNPGQIGFAGYLHQGTGSRAELCQASGEFFPNGRLRQQWNRKQVGDIYWLENPYRPREIRGG
jgi:hypothetical protein